MITHLCVFDQSMPVYGAFTIYNNHNNTPIEKIPIL